MSRCRFYAIQRPLPIIDLLFSAFHEFDICRHFSPRAMPDATPTATLLMSFFFTCRDIFSCQPPLTPRRYFRRLPPVCWR